MIDRTIREKLLFLSTKFPVVSLTGIRQCGKSTLLRGCFPQYRYVSLEDLDMRHFAQEDPRGFLRNFPDKTIIDEAQYAPGLFSYIQTWVDEADGTGMYILSGSHNFLLMQNISQSLAGRCAVLRLAPFSVRELQAARMLPATLEESVFTGGFPRIYDKSIGPADYFPSYIQTYVERDVRLLRNIGDQSVFVRFLKLCAARVGQLLNVQSLAAESGISVPTVKSWLSILETSHVIFLLRPYYRNYNKRLVKTPKLYFIDTGLVASLVGLTDASQLALHYLRGTLFENFVVADVMKGFLARGEEPQMYFWRDSTQLEVDLLTESGEGLCAYEVKISSTMNASHFDGIRRFREIVGPACVGASVIYGGDRSLSTSGGKYVSWRDL